MATPSLTGLMKIPVIVLIKKKDPRQLVPGVL